VAEVDQSGLELETADQQELQAEKMPQAVREQWEKTTTAEMELQYLKHQGLHHLALAQLWTTQEGSTERQELEVPYSAKERHS
jgi:hypothetical protein